MSPLELRLHQVKLQKKYDNWQGSKHSTKYIDLCYKLAKCSTNRNTTSHLEILQNMVDIAKEISFKLSFEQMIMYSEKLIKPDDSFAPVLSSYEKGEKPNQSYFKNLEWICNSLTEMKARNFRPKQITECEAHVAIAYYKCKNYPKAYHYFMKSLDYKCRNLSDNMIFAFLMCGIDTMKELNKKEELLQFYRIRSQYGNNNSEGYVMNMIAMFETDWELYAHETVEASPCFNDVLKSIDRLVNEGRHPSDEVDSYYLDFALSLVKLGITSDWVPKLLAAYNLEGKYTNDYHLFRYQFCKMKYFILKGGKYNKIAVAHGNMAKNIYERGAIELIGADDPDHHMGVWNLLTIVADANVELGNFKKAITDLKSAAEDCYEEQFKVRIIDKLSKLQFWYGNVSEGRKSCEEQLDDLRNLNSAAVLIFDPSIRIAQCWRKEFEFERAKEALDDSIHIDENYKHIFRGICNLYISGATKSDQSTNACDTEFQKVIENVITFKDVKNLINKNRNSLELFPEDIIHFVDRILPISKKILKKTLVNGFC